MHQWIKLAFNGCTVPDKHVAAASLSSFVESFLHAMNINVAKPAKHKGFDSIHEKFKAF